MDLNTVDNKKDDAAIPPRVSIRLNNFYFLFNYSEKWDGLFIWTFCRIKLFSDNASHCILASGMTGHKIWFNKRQVGLFY